MTFKFPRSFSFPAALKFGIVRIDRYMNSVRPASKNGPTLAHDKQRFPARPTAPHRIAKSNTLPSASRTIRSLEYESTSTQKYSTRKCKIKPPSAIPNWHAESLRFGDVCCVQWANMRTLLETNRRVKRSVRGEW